MSVNFTKSFYLLLIPLVLVFLIYTVRKNAMGSRNSRIIFTTMRTIVCMLLILSIAGMTIGSKSDITTTVFTVDISASTKDALSNTRSFLTDAQKGKGKNDRVGIVCFGEKAVLEVAPTDEITLGGGFLSYVKDGASNLADGLKLSASAIPEKSRKRIVLISDGNETDGDVLAQAKILKGQGIIVDVFPLKNETKEEVQLSGLKIPKVISKNMEYDISLQLDSTVDTRTNIKLYKGNAMIADEWVHVTKGNNKILFSDKTDKGGSVIYRAEITPEKDTQSRNNKAYAYSYITDVPQVLLVEKNESGAQWKKLLETAKVNLTVVSAGSAPSQLEKLNLYDGIIIADVSAKAMPKGFPQALESYIKNTGGGLLVSGGENSFALGEYYNTKFEEFLPVDMELKSEGENPSLGMVIVIDRSGSMTGGEYGISKMEMAKEAAIRSLDCFQPEDSLGVLAFDDKAEWAVEIQKTGGNRSAIEKDIGSIQPGGGTSILPALTEAYDKLKDSKSKQKHIILLTDGQAEQTGYKQVVQQITDRGITLSTVAVGGDSDTILLERLAKDGGGRYYFTNEFTDLPEIFMKETILAGKDYINNRSFYPIQQDASPILSGVDGVPKLDGYIGTTAKARADVILKSDQDDPILASWQYGLGRSAVWTSDMNNRWTREWLSSSEGTNIMRNTLSWVMKKQAAQDISVEADRKGSYTQMNIGMPYDKDIAKVKATVISSEHKQYEIDLTSSAPGIYRGKTNATEEGAYIMNLQIEKKDGSVETVNSGFHISYPKEFNVVDQGNGQEILSKVADITGGRVLEGGAETFAQAVGEVSSEKDMTVLLLILALFIFLIDVALRRFSVATQKLEEWCVKRKNWLRKKRDVEKTDKKKEPVRPKKEEKFKRDDLEQKNMKKSKKQKEQEKDDLPKQSSTISKLAEAKRKRGK